VRRPEKSVSSYSGDTTVLQEASMGSLLAGIAGAVDGLSRVATDNTPYVPSAPVQIGTSGAHHSSSSQITLWRDLIMMMAAVIVIGTVVLLYVVRQRTRLLERRRLRRMAEAAAQMGDSGGDGGRGSVGAAAPGWGENPAAAPAPPATAPATPGGAAPSA
jgi:hypothetical protein